MKKLSYFVTLAVVLALAGNQMSNAQSKSTPVVQPVPVTQPCPVAKPCPIPCPAPATKPCPVPCPIPTEQKACPTPSPTKAAPCPCPTETQNVPAPCQNPETSNLSISDTINSQPDLKTLSSLIQYAGSPKLLKGKGPHTVFAPTDEAFAKLPKGTVESLMTSENKLKLEKIMKYHIVDKDITCSDITDSKQIRTTEGETITISRKGDQLYVNNAQVVKGDINTKNGKIYTIDTVLMPSK